MRVHLLLDILDAQCRLAAAHRSMLTIRPMVVLWDCIAAVGILQKSRGSRLHCSLCAALEALLLHILHQVATLYPDIWHSTNTLQGMARGDVTSMTLQRAWR